MLLWIITGCLLATASAVTVEVEVGEDAILECVLAGTFPDWFGPPNFASKLTSAGKFTAPGMTYKDDKHLNISNAQTTHSGDYKCVKSGGEGTVTLVVNSYDVSVTLVDTSNSGVAGSGQVGGIQGDETAILCTITGGYPRPTVTMSIKESNTDLGTPTVTSSLTDQNTYDMNATVTINATREFDLKHVVCNATYDSVGKYQTAEAELYWTVNPLVHSFGWSLSGSTGNTFHCQTDNGRPRTTITFEIGGEALSSDYTYELNATKCVMDSVSRLWTCKSDLLLKDLKKEDNGKPVICVKTFQGQRSNISNNFKIIRQFPPTSVNVTADGPIAVEEQNGQTNVTLTCSVDSAYSGEPASSGVWITWFKGSVQLANTSIEKDTPSDYGGLATEQDLLLTVDRDMDGQEITCKAGYILTLKPIEGRLKLNISYTPIITEPSSAVYRAYINDRVAIACLADSKPASTFKWIHVGVNETEITVTDANTADNMYTMVIDNAQTSHAGTYRCEVQNGIGQTATKSIELFTFKSPEDPVFTTMGSSTEKSFTIQVDTSNEAPSVPETFYVQYRKSSPTPGPWLELTKPISNTQVGEKGRQETIQIENAEPGVMYDVRIKRVTALGLTSYSSLKQVSTKESEETVEKADYDTAIIISVLVTAAVFVVIILIVVVMMRRGACGGSSKTGSAEFSMR